MGEGETSIYIGDRCKFPPLIEVVFVFIHMYHTRVISYSLWPDGPYSYNSLLHIQRIHVININPYEGLPTIFHTLVATRVPVLVSLPTAGLYWILSPRRRGRCFALKLLSSCN